MREPSVRRDSDAALTSWSTSARRTLRATIIEPDSARSRSRAIVSVSGSSGTPLQFPPPDVATELLPLELDRTRDARTLALGVRERRADGGHGEDSSARSDQLASRIERCSRVKNVDVRLPWR